MIESTMPISSLDVAAHYDELDELYQMAWGEHLHHGLWTSRSMTKEEAVFNLVNFVAELARIKEGDKVCDIGCGYGATARFIATSYLANVVGLTVSHRQYQKSQTLPTARVEIRQQDFLNGTLAASEFDHAISIESSEHMNDKPNFFNEVKRILKPGGRFVVCAWMASPALTEWQRKQLIEPICTEGRLPQMGTLTDYKAWISNSGLKLETCFDVSTAVQRTWSIALRDLGKLFLKNPKFIRQLLPSQNPQSVFIKSLFRIPVALKCGAMEYHILAAKRT